MTRYEIVGEWLAEYIRANHDPACSKVLLWTQDVQNNDYGSFADSWVDVQYVRAGEHVHDVGHMWRFWGTVDELIAGMR